MRRLERIAACMRVLRKSRQAVATFGALAAVGMAPASLQGFALDMFSRKASAVATNVPGPQMPLYLALMARWEGPFTAEDADALMADVD